MGDRMEDDKSYAGGTIKVVLRDEDRAAAVLPVDVAVVANGRCEVGRNAAVPEAVMVSYQSCTLVVVGVVDRCSLLLFVVAAVLALCVCQENVAICEE